MTAPRSEMEQPIQPKKSSASRPALPKSTTQLVLIESGHRCAVCGAPTPLERAHIIPWHKTQDHSAENLVCLCANCHQRADHEKWGAESLRAYKKTPWILRQQLVDDEPVAYTEVELVLRLDIDEFTDTRQRLVKFALAAFLDLAPEKVQIVAIRDGSVKVTVRLPREAALGLIERFQTGDAYLREFIAPFEVSDIQHTPHLGGADALLSFAVLLVTGGGEEGAFVFQRGDFYHWRGEGGEFQLGSRIRSASRRLKEELVRNESGLEAQKLVAGVQSGLAPKVLAEVAKLPFRWRQDSLELGNWAPTKYQSMKQVDYLAASETLARSLISLARELEGGLRGTSSSGLVGGDISAEQTRRCIIQSLDILESFRGAWILATSEAPVKHVPRSSFFSPLEPDQLSGRNRQKERTGHRSANQSPAPDGWRRR